MKCQTTPMMSILMRKRMRILLLMLAFILSLQSWSKIYLVSVGISDYPGRQNDLRLPHNDATTMHWLYNENRHCTSTLLTNHQATVGNVKAAMKRLYAQATANDIIVLFFSGHGMPGSFVCYDGLLRYADIRAIMSACRSKSKMVFADACYSGAFRTSGRQSGNGWKGTNIMLFLSCRTNEISIEIPSKANGFFTYALQHGLRGEADVNRDRTITARELFDYVSIKVRQMSNNQQHPVMWGKFPNTMPVMRW